MGCVQSDEERVPPKGEKPRTELRFTEHLIMDGYSYPFGIAAADLDGDGDLDLTSADGTGHSNLYWFQNDGSGSFKRHLIQENDPVRLERHRIGDIDGDGEPDVAIVKNKIGDLLWFENSGDPSGPWTEHRVKDDWKNANHVILADLDGDSDLDIAACAERGSLEFRWWRNEGPAPE